MIPRPHIAKWQKFAPWRDFAQVEQDLVISRTLVEIFSDDFLSSQLAFRGGTALHKLYLHPASRYSEDIDLDLDEIVICFKEYITLATGNKPPSKKEFLINLNDKENDPVFNGDMEALLRTDIEYNLIEAFQWVKNELIERL